MSVGAKPALTKAEAAAETALRNAISDALRGDGLPLSPLIEIVIGYALPFRGVVTTLAGPNPSVKPAFRRGMVNGASEDARFDSPFNLCLHVNPKSGARSVLVCDYDNNLFRSVDLTSGAVSELTSECDTEVVVRPGTGLSTRGFTFQNPSAVCVDPTNAHCIYVADGVCIRSITASRVDADLPSGVISHIAGSPLIAGWCDGAGDDPRFDGIFGLHCTADGRTLYASDHANDALRSIDTQTGCVATVAVERMRPIDTDTGARLPGVNPKLVRPRALAVDTTREPDAALFMCCDGAFLRFDTKSHNLCEFVIKYKSETIDPAGVASLPGGKLLLTSRNAFQLLEIDVATATPSGNGYACECELLAGIGLAGCADGSALGEAQFNEPTAVCVDETERCAIVCDEDNRSLRRITLPPRLFPLSFSN